MGFVKIVTVSTSVASVVNELALRAGSLKQKTWLRAY